MITLERINPGQRARAVNVGLSPDDHRIYWGYKFHLGTKRGGLELDIRGPDARYKLVIDSLAWDRSIDNFMATALGLNVIDPAKLAAAILAAPGGGGVVEEIVWQKAILDDAKRMVEG